MYLILYPSLKAKVLVKIPDDLKVSVTEIVILQAMVHQKEQVREQRGQPH